jgi:hypothetical protein
LIVVDIIIYSSDVSMFARYRRIDGRVYIKNMFSSSDEEELLHAIAKSQQKRKRIWVHEINKKRENYGKYHRLCRELESHEDRFYLYFRMSQDSFEELYQLILPRIEKITTNWRKPISARERLAICLRYAIKNI